MTKIQIFNESAEDTGSFSWSYTPWDTNSLGKKSAEIHVFDIHNESQFHSFLNEQLQHIDAELIYGRFGSSDGLVKRLLITSGFFVTEVSLGVYLSNLQRFENKMSNTKMMPEVENAQRGDIDDIKLQMKGFFNYSRFHEDPFISRDKADLRMMNWIEDMWGREEHVLVAKKNQKVIGFMFFSIEGTDCSLILGGVNPDNRLMAYFFWCSILEELKLRGVKKVRTVISAANQGVLAIYQRLGFLVKDCRFDYHLHRNN